MKVSRQFGNDSLNNGILIRAVDAGRLDGLLSDLAIEDRFDDCIERRIAEDEEDAAGRGDRFE